MKESENLECGIKFGMDVIQWPALTLFILCHSMKNILGQHFKVILQAKILWCIAQETTIDH